MKAIAYQEPLPIDDPRALQDRELPEPTLGARDVLIEVRAISVNPVDTKIRAHVAPPSQTWRVLGWDASGIVRAVGSEATLFKPGDKVWYAGDLHRAGSNSELQAVDERLVGHAPTTLNFAQAAAMPLTTLTAWELLFDRMQLQADNAPEARTHEGETALVIGAAGGVGSILIQLMRQLTGLNIIATASRPESMQWVQALGAHHVIDHRQGLTRGLQAQNLPAPEYVISLNQTAQYVGEIANVIAPQGRLGLIDDPRSLDIRPFKEKSVSVHWEFIFTRAMFQTSDMGAQHRLLTHVAGLIDSQRLRTTVGAHVGRIDAAHLRQAHAVLEGGHARGKLVLEDF